jgi:hypothetical protein
VSWRCRGRYFPARRFAVGEVMTDRTAGNDGTLLNWFYSVGKKFIRIVPGFTILIVLATVVSQLSLFGAFFLPLKTVILIGSPRVPDYFPAVAHSYGREALIIGLSLSSAAFYVLYLIAEKVIGACTFKGAEKLLASSSKIILFEGQDEVANRAYQRYARSLAGAAFVALGLAVLFILYWKIAIVTVLYWGLALFAFRLLAALGIYEGAIGGGTINIVSSIGFLLVFGYVVTEALFGLAPGLFFVMLTLIFSRQVMQRIGALVQDIGTLYTQRLQINALFFHGHKLQGNTGSERQAIWSLLSPEKRDEWQKAVLGQLTGIAFQNMSCRWLESGIHDIFVFEVDAFEAYREAPRRYLIKLYNRNRTSLALHEAALLANAPAVGGCAIEFIGVDSVEDFQCHVFNWQAFDKPGPREVLETVLDVSARLMDFVPPLALVERYSRSKSFVWDRLKGDVIQSFAVALSGTGSDATLKEFVQALPLINHQLRFLPLQILNPDLTWVSLFRDDKGKGFCS